MAVSSLLFHDTYSGPTRPERKDLDILNVAGM